jgi:integrase
MRKVWGPYTRPGRPNHIWIGWYEGGDRKAKPFPADRPEWAERFKLLKTAQLNSDLPIFGEDTLSVPWDMLQDEYIKRKKVDGLSAQGIYQIENTLKSLAKISGVKNSRQITQGVVDRFILKRADEVARPTVNKDIRNVKAFLKWASEMRYVDRDIKAKQLKVARKPDPPLNDTQIKNLLISAAKHPGWKERCLIALTTGLRRSDIESLKIASLDFEAHTMHTTSQKTGKAMTNRPLPPDIIPVLTSYIASLPEGSVSLWTDTHTGKKWKTIRDEAGLAGLKFHKLRKQFGTMLAQGGASTALVGDMLEHASEQTTKEIYIHLPNEEYKKAIEKLPVKNWL